MTETKPERVPPTCRACAWFKNDPALLETAFRGLASMGSGFASVRAEDGLCERHGIYLPAWDGCADFTPPERMDLTVSPAMPS